MYRIYVLHKSFREVGNLRWLLGILGIYIVVRRRRASGRGSLLVSLLIVYVFSFILLSDLSSLFFVQFSLLEDSSLFLLILSNEM